MRRVFTVAALLILVVSADAALAQTAQERINGATARAQEAGVPVALLESKIAEGKAKGVPLDRIAAAVERREAALEKANEALRGRPDVNTADLSVAADAVESGVSAAVLKSLAETAPRSRRVVAIAALTELVRRGTVPDAALSRVKDALQRGPDALANLPAQASAAQDRGAGQSGGSQGGGNENGRGNTQGPPTSVPSPGGATEPTKPGGKPAETGKPTTTPGNAGGRGRSGQ